jgi:hypothetical protein
MVDFFYWGVEIFKSLQEAEAKIETISNEVDVKLVADHTLEKFLVAWGGPLCVPGE